MDYEIDFTGDVISKFELFNFLGHGFLCVTFLPNKIRTISLILNATRPFNTLYVTFFDFGSHISSFIILKIALVSRYNTYSGQV